MSVAPEGVDGLPAGAFAAALAYLPGVGPAWLVKAIAAHGPRQAWGLVCAGQLRRPAPSRPGPAGAGLWAEAARRLDVGCLWARLVRAGIAVTWPGELGYPAALAVGPSPAGVLFRAGDAAMLDGRPCVAVVGTRRCTPEGAAVAYRLGYDLSEAGVRVVSGLALGIDGAAHAGALAAARDARAGEAGRAGPGGGIGTGGNSGEGVSRGLDGPGSTVGVAASGVDVVYPRRHAELWREVVRVGAVISETPPGTPAQAWRFPVRNRIIAGLARMVVVVECHASGGSWHTVDVALRRGVEVGAVPGSVQNSASAGSNTLLHEGATPVRGARDVLDALGMLGGPARAPRAGGARREIGAAPSTRGPGPVGELLETPVRRVDAVEAVGAVGALEAKVLAAIGWRPLCLEEVVERSGLPVTAVLVALEQLERRGALEADAGWWARKRC